MAVEKKGAQKLEGAEAELDEEIAPWYFNGPVPAN